MLDGIASVPAQSTRARTIVLVGGMATLIDQLWPALNSGRLQIITPFKASELVQDPPRVAESDFGVTVAGND